MRVSGMHLHLRRTRSSIETKTANRREVLDRGNGCDATANAGNLPLHDDGDGAAIAERLGRVDIYNGVRGGCTRFMSSSRCSGGRRRRRLRLR